MKHLPIFPKFRLFKVKDISWYKEFYLKSKLSPYADVHYENLLSWLNLNHDLKISKLDNSTIVLCYKNPLNRNSINFLPLSKELTDDNILKIFDYIETNNINASMQEIPNIICDKLDKNIWALSEYRDGAEYILDTKQQIELLGNSFKEKRREIYVFEKSNNPPKKCLISYDRFSKKLKKIFINFIKEHSLNYNKESECNNINEMNAINNILSYSKKFKKKAYLLKIDKKITAIAIASIIDETHATLNHLKVDYSYKHIFQYSMHLIIEDLYNMGLKELNIEQDLGIQGMRQFKKSLRPSRMLEKVTICKKDS